MCNEPRVAISLASAATVAAVERLARADRRHAATTDQWDADAWSLNTPAGIVDLRDGDMRPHDPAEHLTRITAVAPVGDCPTWLAFLPRVTGERRAAGFIQRMLGYALTGDHAAHALFFLYGTGANGKSVLLDTVAGILADYHRTAPIETFAASNASAIRPSWPAFAARGWSPRWRPRRAGRWAEAQIKTLTGGDRIARGSCGRTSSSSCRSSSC